MAQTAKLFKNGRSQAVRLPSEFRFEGEEVFIRKDEATGDVVLSRKAHDWDAFFQLRDELGPVAEDFMAERDRSLPPERDLF
ncbi:antitoxin [Granulicella cerasi]|uniref:Antitoxin n=1 Tax=Granulicella cerasi TaxID=741063 RepID=A0ABW1ZC55_9BACT|nr:type II toxin-antitoxin system VapB family antitoxin [Granulicella cerasi]